MNEDLLERFEATRNKMGFRSKSEALREAIVMFIKGNERFAQLEGYKIMVINLVYPFTEIIISQLSELYSHYHQIIKTVTDWRIANKKIEMLLTVGEFGQIKDLKKKISSIKDVICSINEIIID